MSIRRIRRPATASRIDLEPLEGRALLSVSAGGHRPRQVAPEIRHALVEKATAPALARDSASARVATPLGRRATKPRIGLPVPGSLTPSQIKVAYEYPTSVARPGQGTTIAIVDAYDDPNISTDLAIFSAQFGLPQMNVAGGPSFFKAEPEGRPAANGGWAQEMALDVEWAHAIAPYANILLVEARNSGEASLLAGVDYATGRGANVVAMSWGGGEFAAEVAADYHFNHPGVTYLAAAGDDGTAEWPAVSSHVVAVGGTTLYLNADSTWLAETAWQADGGGLSAFEAKPDYQANLPYASRTSPDVSYDADPNTGYAVYDSYRYQGASGWLQIGGTSAAVPQWAAIVALADQERGSSLDSSQTLGTIYQLSTGTTGTEQLHDITSGSTLTGTAAPGYDLATGLGTPHASRVIAALAATA